MPSINPNQREVIAVVITDEIQSVTVVTVGSKETPLKEIRVLIQLNSVQLKHSQHPVQSQHSLH